MGAGEFSQGERDGPTDEGGQDEGEDDRGSSQRDSGCGAEEQSGADGAADGDHGHLSGGELAVQAGFGIGLIGQRSVLFVSQMRWRKVYAWVGRPPPFDFAQGRLPAGRRRYDYNAADGCYGPVLLGAGDSQGCGQGCGTLFAEILTWRFGGRAGLDYPVAALAFCLVESVVGKLEEQVNPIGGFIEGGDTDGHGQRVGRLLSQMGAGFGDALADNLGAHIRLLKIALGQNQSEFFTAVAAGDVFGTH